MSEEREEAIQRGSETFRHLKSRYYVALEEDQETVVVDAVTDLLVWYGSVHGEDALDRVRQWIDVHTNAEGYDV